MREIVKYILSLVTHRMVVLLFVIVFAFSILVARLFQMQVVNGQKFDEEFELKVLRDVAIDGRRGNIYDRNGVPLTENQISYSVTYDTGVYTKSQVQDLLTFSRILLRNGEYLNIDFPIFLNENGEYRYKPELSETRISRFQKDLFEKENVSAVDAMDALSVRWFKKSFADEAAYNRWLSELLPAERLYLVSLRYAIWANGFYKFIPEKIARNIKPETLAELQENREKLPGFQIVEDYNRVYFYPEYFSHIIGYIGSINEETFKEYEEYGYGREDQAGRIGIEKSMELMLHGVKGYQTVEVDSLGRIKKVLATVEPKGGKNIFLTIDKDLQIQTQDILVRQMANIIKTRLVLRHGQNKDRTAPLLKDAYVNLVDNNTIDLAKLLQAQPDGENQVYQASLKKAAQSYKQKRLEKIKRVLAASDVSANEDLKEFFAYYLESLVHDGILSKDYKKTTGYEDFEKKAISFKGLLEFYFKDGFIPAEYNYEQISQKQIIEKYSENFTFEKKLFLEMLDKELLPYRELSLTLIEQGAVEVDDATQQAVKAGRLGPLEFMKKMIGELKLMPAQVALDPCTGAAVVTDVHTGEVLALAMYPSYDNNRLVNQFDNDYYQQLLADKANPLYPTATQGRTAPGSTFKVLSAIAGLQEGVITKNTLLTCTGVFTKLTPHISCWIAALGGSHGSIPLRRAIGVSCNSYFNEVGYRLATEKGAYDPAAGDEVLRKYTAMFGLSTLSGIELPEAMPISPGSLNPADHIANPATAAMGQEQNAYSAVHLARYMNTVGNGGTLYYLTLIHQINEADGRIYYKQVPKVEMETGIPASTFQAVYEGMKDVNFSSYGTGVGVFRGFPIEVGGKTGTAQQTNLRADHSVYVSLAPMSDPEIAVVVTLPFGSTPLISSAGITGAVARDIYAYYYELEKEYGTPTDTPKE